LSNEPNDTELFFARQGITLMLGYKVHIKHKRRVKVTKLFQFCKVAVFVLLYREIDLLHLLCWQTPRLVLFVLVLLILFSTFLGNNVQGKNYGKRK